MTRPAPGRDRALTRAPSAGVDLIDLKTFENAATRASAGGFPPSRREDLKTPPLGAPDPVLGLLEQLRDEVTGLRVRVDALEARCRPRDAADAAVLTTIAAQIGGTRFTSADVLSLAREDLLLADALEAADITTTRELGALLARLDGESVAGYTGPRRAPASTLVWQLLPAPGSLGSPSLPGD